MHRYVKFTLLSVVLLIANVCSGNVVEINHVSSRKIDVGVNPLRSLSLENLIENYNTTFVYQENDGEGNDTCDRDLLLLQQALRQGDTWALQMLDASSKLPSGILQGNLIDLGMYDECVAINNVTLTGIKIRGRHCMYTPNIMRKNESILPVKLTISVCLPASCGPQDVATFIESVNSAVPWNDLTISAGAVTCSIIDKEIWDLEFIICLSLFMVLVSFLVICSFYDALSNDGKLNVFKQFSLQRNAAAIMSTKVKKDNLPAIHGLRAFSMAWVVLGHEFLLNLAGVAVNKVDVLTWIQSWTSLYIFTAPFAVDTFFTVSGFLMTYLFLKQMSKRKNFNIIGYYLHRYIRLTPSVIALLVFSVIVLPKLGSGARWESYTSMLAGKCRDKWWPMLLYVQNFVDKNNICLPHLWYLAADMQLFWISPFILYPLLKWPKIGLVITTLLVAGSLTITTWIIADNEYPLVSFIRANDAKLTSNAFQDVYEVPYVRAGPWLIGIFLGYEIANNNRRLNKSVVCTGWIVTALCFSFCIFGTRYFMDPGYEYDIVLETFFSTISRPIWAFGICWIIFACVNGRGGIVHKILNWRGFLPLSRLSYCIYLVHFIIQIINSASVRTPIYFTDYFVWRIYFGDLILSVVIAFFFSLLFESPILVLEKMILKGSR